MIEPSATAQEEGGEGGEGEEREEGDKREQDQLHYKHINFIPSNLSIVV